MATSLFQRQPWKAVFVLYHLVTTLTIRASLWLALSIIPFTRTHSAWSFRKDFSVRFLKQFLYVFSKTGSIGRVPMPTHIAILEGLNIKGVWVAPTPHLIVGDVKRWAKKAHVESIRIPGYWMEPEGSNRETGEAPRPGERVVYHLHGGGYTHHTAHPTGATANIPRGIMQHSDSVLRAFNLEYRLSKGPPSTNPFPTALLDAIAGYNYLVNHVKFKPEDIIVEGDSAGGNLAIALIRYLIENQSQTESPEVTIPPPPGELILCSPWADIGDSDVKPGSSIYTNRSVDYLDMVKPSVRTNKLKFLGPFEFAGANFNRYISPGSTASTMEPVSFKGFPRTFITAGDAEVLVDQIRTLRERMVADMGEGMVEYYEAHGAIHDYLVFVWFDPERTEALRRITNWLAR